MGPAVVFKSILPIRGVLALRGVGLLLSSLSKFDFIRLGNLVLKWESADSPLLSIPR
jgi:hypothetical protein